MATFPVVAMPPFRPYRTTGVLFDGTNDWLVRSGGLSGAADGASAIISFWALMNGGDAANQALFNIAGTTVRVFIQRGATNKWDIGGRDTGGVTIRRCTSSNSYTVASGWHHVLASWDGTTSRMYINDVSDAATATNTGGSVDWTFAPDEVGVQDAAGSPAIKLNANIADFYIHQGASLDISVTANRRKFITSDLKPVFLGADGSLPTGSQPIMFLKGTASAFANNLGSGGAFTVTGALTDTATSPSD